MTVVSGVRVTPQHDSALLSRMRDYLVPRLPHSVMQIIIYIGRAWYLFSREHDVIENERPEFLEQKGNIVQPTMRSILCV